MCKSVKITEETKEDRRRNANGRDKYEDDAERRRAEIKRRWEDLFRREFDCRS